MKIQDQDLFHGAALTQIVQHESFKALNRGSKTKYGHYLINTNRHVFVKYRKPNQSPWQHTFSEDEIDAIANQIKKRQKVFLCLVCGKTTVCALRIAEIKRVLDMKGEGQQWVRVEVPKGGRCHVSGSNGRLAKTVAHSAFPEKVFV
ncbi:MAG: hypothetical protein HOL01_07730 [Planctomycetaceae bacterium]|jgi:hypothetical protein|nr:hypothetical protein [Planctomycetaceae bacterium]MBT6484885.1 hypothetical protein [Planctomycetaceae bacterium]MBT6494427.1 hypothetical protein [Planctomycetaceae bacterium]